LYREGWDSRGTGCIVEGHSCLLGSLEEVFLFVLLGMRFDRAPAFEGNAPVEEDGMKVFLVLIFFRGFS